MADKLITTRNLVDGDLGPLRRLTGVLDSMPTDVKTYGEGENEKKTTNVVLNLKEIEVVEAVEPYAFPIYSTRPLSLSNRKKSRWGVLSESFNALVDAKLYTQEQLDPSSPNYVKPSERMDIEQCVGKRIGLVLSDGQDGRPQPPDLYDGRANNGAGGDVPTPTWMIYSVEGIGVTGASQTTPQDEAMRLLDNKTIEQFNTDALANSIIRESELLQSISLPLSAPGSFANLMITTGKFTKDEATGIYHKVEGGAVATSEPAPAPAPEAATQ